MPGVANPWTPDPHTPGEVYGQTSPGMFPTMGGGRVDYSSTPQSQYMQYLSGGGNPNDPRMLSLIEQMQQAQGGSWFQDQMSNWIGPAMKGWGPALMASGVTDLASTAFADGSTTAVGGGAATVGSGSGAGSGGTLMPPAVTDTGGQPMMPTPPAPHPGTGLFMPPAI